MQKWLVIPLVVILSLTLVVSGCEKEVSPPAPAVAELAETMVPNLPLDVYFYLKQAQPTRLPPGTFGLPSEVSVVSLAVWGVAREDEVGYGVGLTLSSAQQAREMYDGASGLEGWTRLSGSTVYFVYGSGTAARSLGEAIEAGDFKRYDDDEGLAAAATLPGAGEKIAALALVKPSSQLIGALTAEVDENTRGLIDLMLGLVRLKVIAAGVYAPGLVDVAGLMADFNAGGISADRDLGVLAMLQSGLPGFVVKPAVGKLLDEQGFQRTGTGDYDLYQRSWASGDGGTAHVIIRVEGSQVFIAISGRESYAETLILSVKR